MDIKKIVCRTMALAGCMVGAVFAGDISVAQKQDTVVFSAAGRPLIEYRSDPAAYKPYVLQMYSPAGAAVLRDAPADHVHHHGLMFAVAVEGTTFWEEIIKGNVLGGRQLVRRTEVRENRVFQQLDWQATNNVMVLKEARTVIPHVVSGVTLLTWRSCLEPSPGKSAVTFTGHHYYGLGARFVSSMDKVAVFQNAAGDPGEYVRGDNQRLAPAAWVSCTGPVDGKPVTIAIFDHPDNLRYPSKKFTMASPFAYISTTLNFWKEPFVLKAGEKLDLLYGVAVWDGAKTPEQIEAVRQQWLRQAL